MVTDIPHPDYTLESTLLQSVKFWVPFEFFIISHFSIPIVLELRMEFSLTRLKDRMQKLASFMIVPCKGVMNMVIGFSNVLDPWKIRFEIQSFLLWVIWQLLSDNRYSVKNSGCNYEYAIGYSTKFAGAENMADRMTIKDKLWKHIRNRLRP